jgi:hypothetical protein
MNLILIAQNDDPELLEWVAMAADRGGAFVSFAAKAGLHADAENYPLIRPLLMVLRNKYPAYEPSDLVKREIRERMTPEEIGDAAQRDQALEHQVKHVHLHRALDELLACYLAENRGHAPDLRTSIHDEIFQLLKWSHAKTLHPSPPPGAGEEKSA